MLHYEFISKCNLMEGTKEYRTVSRLKKSGVKQLKMTGFRYGMGVRIGKAANGIIYPKKSLKHLKLKLT